MKMLGCKCSLLLEKLDMQGTLTGSINVKLLEAKLPRVATIYLLVSVTHKGWYLC